MSSVTRRFLFNNQSVYILNRLYNPQPCVNCVRKSHVLRNKFVSITDSRLTALASLQNSCNALNSVDYTPVRLKYDKRSSKHDDDEDSDEDESNLDEFRDGDKSDRNLATIKVQTLRLDTVIKAGLGYTKKKTEKLFYDSKIRINGKKVTKKSVDIVKECEIDVIKGPSPDNSDYLCVGRIEVLSIKAEGLYFALTVRRHKNLTVENYEDSGRYTGID